VIISGQFSCAFSLLIQTNASAENEIPINCSLENHHMLCIGNSKFMSYTPPPSQEKKKEIKN